MDKVFIGIDYGITGMQIRSELKDLGISEETASNFKDAFIANFPLLAEYMNKNKSCHGTITSRFSCSSEQSKSKAFINPVENRPSYLGHSHECSLPPLPNQNESNENPDSTCIVNLPEDFKVIDFEGDVYKPTTPDCDCGWKWKQDQIPLKCHSDGCSYKKHKKQIRWIRVK